MNHGRRPQARHARTAVAILLLFAPLRSHAQLATTVQTVVDRHAAAIGGRPAFDRHSSIHRTAKLEIAAVGMNGSLTLDRAKPNRFRVTRDLGALGRSTQGYDGATGWEESTQAGVTLLTGGDLAERVMTADFYSDLRYGRASGYQEFSERVTWQGRDCWKLNARSASGASSVDYYDAGTGLYFGTADEVDSPAGKFPRETMVREYGSFDGLALPVVVVQRLPQFETVITYTETVFDAAIQPLIAAPAVAKKP